MMSNTRDIKKKMCVHYNPKQEILMKKTPLC